MSAVEAVAVVMASENNEGYEVIIPRAITRKELHRMRLLPQVIGWRYMPNSHELCQCMCIVCNPQGSIKSRKKWQKWEDRNQ